VEEAVKVEVVPAAIDPAQHAAHAKQPVVIRIGPLCLRDFFILETLHKQAPIGADEQRRHLTIEIFRLESDVVAGIVPSVRQRWLAADVIKHAHHATSF